MVITFDNIISRSNCYGLPTFDGFTTRTNAPQSCNPLKDGGHIHPLVDEEKPYIQDDINMKNTNTRKIIIMVIRILVVDDQPIVRRGLRMYLSLDTSLEIVGEAANGHEAIQLSELLKPDVILMDIMMPEMNGIEATANVRSKGANITIIALSHSQDPLLINAAIQAGANIYLSKDVQTEQLIRAIKTGSVDPPDILR